MPHSAQLLLTALLGLLFGSFLNVCISRLPLHQSIAWPGSHCPHCQRPLAWFENLPLLSWLCLRAKCRTCHHPISWRYPLVEATLPVLWVECLLHFGATLLTLQAAVLCFLLLGLLVTDLETFLLPDSLTLPGLTLGLLSSFVLNLGPWHGLQHSLAGAAIGAAVPLLIAGAYYLVRRQQGMGMGDVKLLAMVGSFLGPGHTILVFFLGTVATAVAALVWLSLRRIPASRTEQHSLPGQGLPDKWSQQPMPFGTFLAAAAILVLLWGTQILNWYTSKLL